MLRVALLCDFAEEGWTSMDFVGEMLFAHLQRWHRDTLRTDRLLPVFRRRITAPRMLRQSRAAWNGDRLWNRIVEYPRWLREQTRNYDLFHIIDHSYAHLAAMLPPERTIVTCHDLDAFRPPASPFGFGAFWYRTVSPRILAGLRAARHVIFVSEAVRQEAIRLRLVAESCSSVIHNGGDGTPEAGADADREAERLIGPSAGVPLLLSVGSTVPRKRMDVLLRLLAGIVADFPGARLIRVGGSLTRAQMALATQLGVSRSIVELPFVERDILGAVYRKATLLVQPSDSEGFGLPVVEAMAQGCPVVASDLPVLREVGGDAAMFCPAGDVSRWIIQVRQSLIGWREDPVFWSRLRSRSLENARRFRWREHAARVASVYQEIAGQVLGEGRQQPEIVFGSSGK